MSVSRDQAEFSVAMLVALRRYKPKVARQILREAQADFDIAGPNEVERLWGKFVELAQRSAID